MKNRSKILVIALGLAGSALLLTAQDNGGTAGDQPPRHGPGRPGGPGGPSGDGPHHPPPPLIAVLDANHDGVIDEQEIANAPAALLTLDKNGDGKLTMDELRPPPPDGQGGPGAPGANGFRGPRGPRGGPPQGNQDQSQQPPRQAGDQ